MSVNPQTVLLYIIDVNLFSVVSVCIGHLWQFSVPHQPNTRTGRLDMVHVVQ